jgi:hypothetical protein
LHRFASFVYADEASALNAQAGQVASSITNRLSRHKNCDNILHRNNFISSNNIIHDLVHTYMKRKWRFHEGLKNQHERNDERRDAIESRHVLAKLTLPMFIFTHIDVDTVISLFITPFVPFAYLIDPKETYSYNLLKVPRDEGAKVCRPKQTLADWHL